MKKHALILIAALQLLVTVPLAAQAEEPLRIAIEGAFPPFSFITPDGLQGFDVDIAKALCDELNRPCEVKPQPWDGIISGLLVRKYDAIVSSMSITTERQKTVDFSDPYWFAPSRFIALQDAIADDSPESMAGKSVGVQRGTIQEDYLSAVYKDVDVRRYATQEEALLDLAARRVDAVLAPSISLLDFLASDDGAGFALFGQAHSDPTYFGIGAGIAIRKEDKALQHALNEALQRMMDNGRYEEINAKYFATSIRPQ